MPLGEFPGEKKKLKKLYACSPSLLPFHVGKQKGNEGESQIGDGRQGRTDMQKETLEVGLMMSDGQPAVGKFLF